MIFFFVIGVPYAKFLLDFFPSNLYICFGSRPNFGLRDFRLLFVNFSPTLILLATNKDLPYAIRLKSITSLASFNDERSIDAIIDMLKDPENYVFYNEILNLMNARGGYEIFKNRVRKVAFDAMVEYEKGKD